ncbi:MAG: HAD hydrolase family protein, partial [Candidatus Margulisbacteria bacterium]|nr:HAD hydrolase family protein [Candidatus Margulisiibacteriota bacterium]
LPDTLEAAKDILSPEQIIALFDKIIDQYKYTGHIFKNLPDTLEAAKDILSPEQIIALFDKIIDQCGQNAGAFQALSGALKAARNILSPEQIIALFDKIIDQCDRDTSFAFDALPGALEAAKDTLSPQQIIDLFDKITNRCSQHTRFAFKALPVALQAQLSPEQIINLSGGIIDKCGEYMGHGFAALHGVLEAQLSVEQIIDSFDEIIGMGGNQTSYVFKFLPDALEAGLSPKQAIDLSRKIIDKINTCSQVAYEAGLAFNALSKALETAKTIFDSQEIIDFFIEILDRASPENFKHGNILLTGSFLLSSGVSKKDIVSFLSCNVTQNPSPLPLIEDSSLLLLGIKALYTCKTKDLGDFDERWLDLKEVAFLLNKISRGEEEKVQDALRILLKHKIKPSYETLREVVEFSKNYPIIEQGLRHDPSRTNNYCEELQDKIRLDHTYYKTAGQHRKAQILARLVVKNRSEQKIQQALIALRFVDEEQINLDNVRRVAHLERLAQKANSEYQQRLSEESAKAKSILSSDENRKYVQRILSNMGVETELDGISINQLLDIIARVRESVLTNNVMLKVADVYNSAISELSDSVERFSSEANSFHEAWSGEMDMAVDLHKKLISIQSETKRPMLVILNERTAPAYFGRDFLSKSYTQRFGIVQTLIINGKKVSDENLLNILGRKDVSDNELKQVGKELFAHGQILPLHGFKIASSNNDIEDNTLGVYVRNTNRMMALVGGDVAFVDLSRRRVGGANAFLSEYLAHKNLANINPHGKLREKNEHEFDGRRRRYGLMKTGKKKNVTWHLIDPCKINDDLLRWIAEDEYQSLKQTLAMYIGANKPFADDREHAFHKMSIEGFASPAEGIAPRYLKTESAWCIPDLKVGLISIHEYLARITGRVVPEKVNGSLDEIIPYHSFPPYLSRRLDVIFAEHGIKDNALRKRFYGSDCFGYYIRGIENAKKQELIEQLNRSFEEKGLDVVAVDSGKTIDIVQKGVNKGKAVEHFARVTGIDEEKIVRIGDSPLGNDKEMLRSGRAYNVGADAKVKGLVNARAKGAEGVLEVLAQVEAEGFEGIVFDIDGTIDSNARIHQKIAAYLEAGQKVAIATGRGESVRRKFIKKLEKLTLSPAAKQNLHIYLYNGALCLR